MRMSVKVRMLLAAREMSLGDLAKKMETSQQNLTAKLNRDNLAESDLNEIAQACNASYEGFFTLLDDNKQI